MSTKQKNLSVLIALGVAIFALGCGNSTPAVPLPPAPIAPVYGQASLFCGPGQFKINEGCYAAATFQQACQFARGSMITISGQPVCKQAYNYVGPRTGATDLFSWYGTGAFYLSAVGYFPRLTPSMPDGGWATGMRVRAGDKVTMRASGSWGGPTQSVVKFLGINLGTATTVNCAAITVDGRSSKDSTRQYFSQGLIAGLLGSDGVEAYEFGAGSTRQMKNDGYFRFGLNIPDGEVNGACTQIAISQLGVVHCEDATGVTRVCP